LNWQTICGLLSFIVVINCTKFFSSWWSKLPIISCMVLKLTVRLVLCPKGFSAKWCYGLDLWPWKTIGSFSHQLSVSSCKIWTLTIWRRLCSAANYKRHRIAILWKTQWERCAIAMTTQYNRLERRDIAVRSPWERQGGRQRLHSVYAAFMAIAPRLHSVYWAFMAIPKRLHYDSQSPLQSCHSFLSHACHVWADGRECTTPRSFQGDHAAFMAITKRLNFFTEIAASPLNMYL
jgi:hypothetical protein